MIAAAFPDPGLSVIAKSIKALYGMTVQIDAYIDQHLEAMKGSENPTISRTGRVIAAAKEGFGIGYISAVTIIAAGQLLLGNPLSAIATVATAATLTNPIAMTCAAVGAIYYGWGALTDVERNEILDKLSKGLEIGVELVKSIIRFVMDKTKELLSSENLKEIRAFVSSAAATFGKTLGDITKKIVDVAGDTFDAVRQKSGAAASKAADLAAEAYESVKETAGKASDSVKQKLTKSPSKQQAVSRPGLNAWVGARYDECGRVLIVCESTYGMVGDDGMQMLDQDYVPAWCIHHAESRWRDRTFNALYKACAAGGEGRLDFFNRVAFLNLWPHNLGATTDTKVKQSQLREGATTLPRASASPCTKGSVGRQRGGTWNRRRDRGDQVSRRTSGAVGTSCITTQPAP